ncbi:hypothetical protein CR513_31624, partial [Mucuna pruriens]
SKEEPDKVKVNKKCLGQTELTLQTDFVADHKAEPTPIRNRNRICLGSRRSICMTRKRNSGSLHPFDPKIEKTLNRIRKSKNMHRIRKSKNMHVGHGSDSFNSIPEIDHFEIKLDFANNPLFELEPMENNNRTLKKLVTPDVLYQPWCIQYPQLEPAQSYELKSGLIHLLSKFHGLEGEDLHKYLKEFHVVCSMMRPQRILEDYIKMKAFSFSLDKAAKDWLYLQSVMFNT